MKINVQWKSNRSAYYVDTPNWEGGEVVTFDEFETQSSTIERLERELAEALKDGPRERQMWINAIALVLSRPSEVELIGQADNAVRNALRPVAATIANAEALDALGAHLRQNGRDYVEYLAPDDASGEMWRCGISRFSDAFDGTGPTLAAAIMDALRKAKR